MQKGMKRSQQLCIVFWIKESTAESLDVLPAMLKCCFQLLDDSTSWIYKYSLSGCTRCTLGNFALEHATVPLPHTLSLLPGGHHQLRKDSFEEGRSIFILKEL